MATKLGTQYAQRREGKVERKGESPMESVLNAWIFMGWLGFNFWFGLKLWKFSLWLASKS